MKWKERTKARFSLAKDAKKWLNIYTTSSPNVEAIAFRKRRDYTVKQVLAHLPEGGTVLDLGCGAGPVLTELQGAGISCIGVDYSTDMLKLARGNLGPEGSGIPLIQGDCEHIPLPDESVDSVICLGVISYAESIDRAMSELFRVLHKGGFAVVSYRNRYNEYLLDPVRLVSAAVHKWRAWIGRSRVQKEIGRALHPATVRLSALSKGLTLKARHQVGFGNLRFNGRVISDGKVAHEFNRALALGFSLIPVPWLQEAVTDIHILVLEKPAA